MKKALKKYCLSILELPLTVRPKPEYKLSMLSINSRMMIEKSWDIIWPLGYQSISTADLISTASRY